MFKALTTTLIILAITLAAVFYVRQNSSEEQTIKNQANLLPISTDATFPGSELQARAYIHLVSLFGGEKIKSGFDLVEPVQGFKERMTKKPFGIFITPETSPVENDKFTGYHTGVDAEFEDSSEDIPVLAIADGTILVRVHAPGYGGVIVIKHIIDEVPVVALYGHLDPASFLPAAISQVTAGSQIGTLGDNHSEETDGARKHLHFSMYPDKGGEKIDFRGYVETEEELSNWLNPSDFYR